MSHTRGARRAVVDRAHVLIVTGTADERMVFFGRGSTKRLIGMVIRDHFCHRYPRPCHWRAISVRDMKTYRQVRAEWQPHSAIPLQELAAGRPLIVSPGIAIEAVSGPRLRSIGAGVAILVAEARRRLVPPGDGFDVVSFAKSLDYSRIDPRIARKLREQLGPLGDSS